MINEKSKFNILRKIFLFFASHTFGAVIMFFLFILTWLGTLEQERNGLFETQKKYFESFFLWHDFGSFSIPLPGTYLLLILFSISVLAGGVLNARKHLKKPGLLISHLGLLVLMTGCFITYHFTDSGRVVLREGDSAKVFESYTDWVLEIAEEKDDTEIIIIPIDKTNIKILQSGVIFSSKKLPFKIKIFDYYKNCIPQVAKKDDESFDGFNLKEESLHVKTSGNIPGFTLSVITDKVVETSVIWANQRFVYIFELDGKKYHFNFCHRKWNIPFEVTLDKFEHEYHPGTMKPKFFKSSVTRTENNTDMKVLIEMNKPLRHRGYTFFQASWGPQNAPPGTPKYSVLAVSKNPADQWPFYSCIIISFGMLLHFLQKLKIYLNKVRKR